jgi:methyl-accepting chemotaxis protein
MIQDMTVRLKLSLAFAILLFFLVIVAVVGWYGMKTSNDDLNDIVYDNNYKLELSNTMSESVHIVSRVIRSMVMLDDLDAIHTEENKLLAARESYDKAWDEYANKKPAKTERGKLLRDNILKAATLAREVNNKVIILALENKDEEARDMILKTAAPLTKEWQDALDENIKFRKEKSEQLADEAKAEYDFVLKFLFITIVLALALGFFMAKWIIRSILETLGGEPAYTASVIREVSKGNLEVKIALEPNDKSSLLYRVDRMRMNLSNIIVSTNIVMGDVARGDLHSRVEGQFPGDFNTLQQVVNSSLDILRDTLTDVTRVAKALSNGELNQKITKDYVGIFGDTKNSINHTVDELNKLIEEIESIVYSGADCGDFSVKIGMTGKVGYGERLAELINKLFSTTECNLRDILRVSEALAEGDLTQTITADYVGEFAATKAGINATIDHLKILIGDVKEASDSIASASNEISAGNNDLSHRTEEQAASLEQTAASMEQLTATVRENTEHAKNANILAVSASTTAKKGVEVVNEVVHTMLTINESSHRIVDIISVIDDIAFQTNILALNAAVEAARAGEQGKGFAVVAVEVRNLAQRAASAAGEIKHLIDASVGSITAGSKQVEAAGKTMEEIVTAIEDVSASLSEIATASVEQNSGINQVNSAVSQMDTVTQQNAALVEQAAAAAEALSEQAQGLAFKMAQFKTENNNSRKTANILTKPAIKLAKASVKPVSKNISSIANDEWEEF